MSDTEYGHDEAMAATDRLMNDDYWKPNHHGNYDHDARRADVAALNRYIATLEAAHREPVSDDAVREALGTLGIANAMEPEHFGEARRKALATITTALTAAQSERDEAVRLAQTAHDFACELATYDDLVQSVGEWNDAQGEESA